MKAVLGVVVGYIAMAAIVFAGLTAAYFALGTERAFQPGSFAPSGLWLVIWLVTSLAAAVVGGLVCANLSGGGKAPMILAGLVLVFGIISAVMGGNAPAGERPGDLSSTEAMVQATPPMWVGLVNAVLGAAGVMMGARRKPASQ